MACDSAAPGRPDRVVIALPRDGGPVNPYSGPGDALLGLVYDKLFEPSPYVSSPWPGLAVSAEPVDPVTWSVTLRDGVIWHDGEPFTADDVAFTFAYYRDGPPNRYGHHVSDVPLIDSVEVVGPLHVRFHCGYPCPALAHVTMADLPILPRHRWEGVTSPRTLDRLPVGTGPYILQSYQPDQRYRFRANDDYALGTPLFAELVLPVLPDASASFVALRTGQVDAVARPVPPELLAALSGQADLGINTSHALSIVELRPNYRSWPFDDPRVRRALSLSVDREALVERVMLGQAVPGDRGYPHPASPWTAPDTRTPYDPEAADRLLAQAGYVRGPEGVLVDSAGRRLSMDILVDAGESARVRTAELVAHQLRDRGLDLRVVALESGALSERSRVRDYHLFVSEIGPHGAADPDQFVMSHRSGYLWEPSLPFPAWDELFARWQEAATLEARRRVGFEMQRLFNEHPTSIALYYPRQDWAYRRSVHEGWEAMSGMGIAHKWSLVRRSPSDGPPQDASVP